MQIVTLKNGKTYKVEKVTTKVRNSGTMVRAIINGKDQPLCPGFAVASVENV